MVNRKSAGICALLISWCPTVFSQEIPILPAPASIAGLATTDPVASSQVKPASTAGVLRFAPMPAARVPLTVDAEGRSLELRVVAEVADPELPYRYVTAQVRDVPDGYARFLIAGDRIVGTVVTADATYRLLPTDGGQISVHRLADGQDVEARFRQIVDSWNAPDRALERRHVQMERLAQIQPRRVFMNDAGHYFSAEGGDFGKLAGVDAEAVAGAIRNIAELIYAPDPLDLQINKVVPLPHGSRVEFRQTIGGIALFRTNELVTDAAGTIVEISTHFVDPGWARQRRLMSEVEAAKAAIEQVEREAGSPVVEYELLAPTTLWYDLEPGRKLVPYYTFSLRTLPNGKPFGVRVNAHFGEARLLIAPTL